MRMIGGQGTEGKGKWRWHDGIALGLLELLLSFSARCRDSEHAEATAIKL